MLFDSTTIKSITILWMLYAYFRETYLLITGDNKAVNTRSDTFKTKVLQFTELKGYGSLKMTNIIVPELTVLIIRVAVFNNWSNILFNSQSHQKIMRSTGTVSY